MMKESAIFRELQEGCRDSSGSWVPPWTAIRRTLTFEPVDGPGQKVFPPTYSGGNDRSTYVRERRRAANEETWVLLDSVQSQANRLESVLDRERTILKLPNVEVSIPNHGRISAVGAPHRIFDAIFRACDVHEDGTVQAFPDSAIGSSVATSSMANATALLRYCPTALLFGAWDSHGALGGGGVKVPRALVCEVSGLETGAGAKVGSRIDPLGIRQGAGPLYVAQDDETVWTLDESKAKVDDRGKPVGVGSNSKTKGRGGRSKVGNPSVVGLGNVTPSVDTDTGGVYISHAVQTFALSLVQLRQFRFPISGSSDSAPNTAARLLLATLALYAVLRLDADGYHLRSRCQLIPKTSAPFELLGTTMDTKEQFHLDLGTALEWVTRARQQAVEANLPWGDDLHLEPSQRLLDIVARSDRLAGAIVAGDADVDEDDAKEA